MKKAFTNMVMDKGKNIWNLEDNLNTLESKLKILSCRATDFKQQVTKEEQTGKKKRKREVVNWFDEVEQMEKEFNALKSLIQDGGLLRNMSSGDSVAKLEGKVEQLLEQSQTQHFEDLLVDGPPMGIVDIPAPSGTHEFESRKHIEEKIMTCLRDDTIFMIGVCGMGGVGKTTMAKKICRRAREEKICRRAGEEKLFDEIVMTDGLGQEADQLKIQQRIAGPLGLELTNDTITNCARLLQRLTGRNVLLVLDDVWKKLNLEELGIPSQSMNKGCKIILTTRDDRVCIESTDDATEIIKLEVLGEEEAWSLFRNKAGSVVDQDDLGELAIHVAKECKGLPLALVTVGSALKQQTDKAIWEDALLQLRHASPANIPGVLEDVYQPLQLSYNALKSNVEARYLFLLCCLFPEDSRIDLEDLVHYGIGLGIFSIIGNLIEARKRVRGLVYTLKSRFLLMDATDDDGGYGPAVKMHDVVRDMAIWISSEAEGTKHVFKVSHEIGLSEWPIKEDSCENYTAISLTFGESMVIPKECMNCPNPRLEALIVDCYQRKKLPDTFFNRMSGLRLLSLSRCIVPSSSLSLLTQLRVLRLYRCRGLREKISFIGKLEKLEILSLPYDSDIEVLPDEMGALEKLKILDLNGCENLKKIAPGVISRLVQLEELRLNECPIEWEGEEKGKERSNASVVEVFSLRNLRALEIWIRNPQVIPQGHDRGGQLQEKLTSYHVTIDKLIYGEYTYQKRMQVDVNEMRKCGVNSMRALFMGAEDLCLRGRRHIRGVREASISKDILEVLERQGFQNVKRLFLEGIDDLEEICHGPPTLGSFSKLEQIRFYDLPGLTYLWKCSNEKLCLPNLKKILISYCEKLKWVFPLSIAESLCQLETIDIEYCPNMEEVFFKDEIRQGSSEEEGGDDSDHMNIKFPKLKKIHIYGCEKLKWVFPLSIAESLCQLETIEIFRCPNMEEVFFKDEISQGSSSGEEGGGDRDHMNIKFPKLKEMILEGLPKLSALCKAVDVFEFPEITTLEISQVSWWNLKMLGSRGSDLFNNNEVPYIDSTGLRMSQIDVFTGLHKLSISYCSELRTLFFTDAFKSLINLKELSVSNCLILEEIFEKQKDEDQKVLNLPQLKSLELSELPKIRYFCNFKDTLKLPSLKEITITNCPMMETFAVESCSIRMPNSIPKFFFSKEVTCPNLCKLVLEGFKIASVIFSQEFHITGLKELRISHCSELRTLFSSDAFKSLINLKELRVRNCLILKEIVEKQKDEDQKVLNLPQLESLELSELPEIRCFCNFKNTLEFPSLKEITIRNCPLMETFAVESCSTGMPNSSPKFFFSKEVTCPNLCKLVLNGDSIPVNEVASMLANPWERQTKMTNLELERNLPLEPLQNESNSSASTSASASASSYRK